jgi:hypothetical protein
MIIIIIKAVLKAMTKIPMHVKQLLVNVREPASPEHKDESKLLHYDVLYIYSILKVVKLNLGETNIR